MKFFYFLIGMFFCLDLSGQITYWVNTTDDVDDGVCDEMHCSLREAIDISNRDGDASNIYFNIPTESEIIIKPKITNDFNTSCYALKL